MHQFMHYRLVWSISPSFSGRKVKNKAQIKICKRQQLVNSYCRQVYRKAMLQISGADDTDGSWLQHRVRVNRSETDL